MKNLIKRSLLLATFLAFLASAQSAYAYSHYSRSYTPVKYTFTATATSGGEPHGVPSFSGSSTITATLDLVNQAFCYQVTGNGIPQHARGVIAQGSVGNSGKRLIPISTREIGSKHITCVGSHTAILQNFVNNPSNYYYELQLGKNNISGIRGQFHR